MKSPAGPYPFDRIVRPRRPVHDARPIIAIDDDSLLVERTGEVRPIGELPMTLVTEPSSLLLVERASALLAELNRSWLADIRGWQYRVAPVARRIYRQHHRKRPTEVRDVIVAFLGWRFADSKRTHYHYPLDPVVFTGHGLRRVIPVEDRPVKLDALMAWGQDVRAWCQDNGLRAGSGAGALAVQLLKDERFYPEPRRKVPKATNDKARVQLPGNHYELFVKEKTYHDAYYIDMQSAHHHCAADIAFPCANGLLARGRWREPPESILARNPWARKGTRKYERILESHGLILVRLDILRAPGLKWVFGPPYLKKPGLRLAWIYTNELAMIREHGVIIDGIEAAWTSFRCDTGLNTYGEWAIRQAREMSEGRKRWAKPAMLAVYGMLAARATEREFGYAHATGGENTTYMTPGGPLPVQRRKQAKATEAPVVNVIHRGMIEAEVRMRALRLARELHEQKCNVLCVYADSVIVDSNGPFPLIAHPWQIKTPLTRLEFFNPVSFHSDEMTRLPGIPEGEDRIHRLKQMRALTAGGTMAEHGPRFHVPREIRRIKRGILAGQRFRAARDGTMTGKGATGAHE